MPVKPVIIKEHDSDYSISVGVTGAAFHIVLTACYLYHRFDCIELPVIKPTEYMFEHYSNISEDKWEIYAEVVREIYIEIGNFEKSDKNFRDSIDYLNILNGTETLIQQTD